MIKIEEHTIYEDHTDTRIDTMEDRKYYSYIDYLREKRANGYLDYSCIRTLNTAIIYIRMK